MIGSGEGNFFTEVSLAVLIEQTFLDVQRLLLHIQVSQKQIVESQHVPRLRVQLELKLNIFVVQDLTKKLSKHKLWNFKISFKKGSVFMCCDKS